MALSRHIQRILNLTQDPVVVELGACDASHTVAFVMCSLNGTARILSFEPDPRNVSKCLDHLPPSVEFFPAAVGNVTGKVPFHLASPQPDGNIGSSSLSEFKSVLTAFDWFKDEGTIEVDCWRLDDFCAAHDVAYIDLLWADVQGAERMVIEGAQSILRHTRYFWTEFEGRYEPGTLYQDSCSLSQIIEALPGQWRPLEVWGGDALLVNDTCENPHAPITLD